MHCLECKNHRESNIDYIKWSITILMYFLIVLTGLKRFQQYLKPSHISTILTKLLFILQICLIDLWLVQWMIKMPCWSFTIIFKTAWHFASASKLNMSVCYINNYEQKLLRFSNEPLMLCTECFDLPPTEIEVLFMQRNAKKSNLKNTTKSS